MLDWFFANFSITQVNEHNDTISWLLIKSFNILHFCIFISSKCSLAISYPHDNSPAVLGKIAEAWWAGWYSRPRGRKLTVHSKGDELILLPPGNRVSKDQRHPSNRANLRRFDHLKVCKPLSTQKRKKLMNQPVMGH